VPFEPLDEAASVSGCEGLIERSWRVDIEIVLHQHDPGCVREMLVGQVA